MVTHPRVFEGDFILKGPNHKDFISFIDGVLTIHDVALADIAGHTVRGNKFAAFIDVPISVVDGAAAGTFTPPAGSRVLGIWRDTPTTIPGTPTNTNLRIGFRYLRTLVREYKGNVQLALLVYNRGPVAVQASREQGLDPSNGYERIVMKGYKGRGVID